MRITRSSNTFSTDFFLNIHPSNRFQPQPPSLLPVSNRGISPLGKPRLEKSTKYSFQYPANLLEVNDGLVITSIVLYYLVLTFIGLGLIFSWNSSYLVLLLAFKSY